MKSTYASLLVAMVFLIGCNDKSSPGGPGATNATNRQPAVGQAEEMFTLDVPNLSTKVKQGESKQVSIGIRRGRNLDEDVTLSFEDVPKGVTIEPASPVIKKGDTEAKFTLKAAEDAAVGDFTVKVRGAPTRGAVAANTLKVTIDKK